MIINDGSLTKGQKRKLNALRKSIGDKLGSDAFAKWIKEQAKKAPVEKTDPVAEKLLKALNPLIKDKSIKLREAKAQKDFRSARLYSILPHN